MNKYGMILYSDLVEKLDKKVIGRSLSFPEGWITIENIEEIIKQYKERKTMQINTKYEIGTHIWVVDVYNKGGELYLYDTYIIGISIDKNGFFYAADEQNYIELKEEDIILYDDKDKLYEVIKTKMIEANKISEEN